MWRMPLGEGMWKVVSGRMYLGGCVWEDAYGRRNPGGGGSMNIEVWLLGSNRLASQKAVSPHTALHIPNELTALCCLLV